MKKLISALLMLLPMSVFAQNEFTTAGDFIEIKGKWKAISTRPGERLTNKTWVQIECFKDAGHCKEATFSAAGAEPGLNASDYKIISWESSGIVAVNDEPICMTNKLVINFQDHNVTAIDAPKSLQTATAKSCKAYDRIQTYRLVK